MDDKTRAHILGESIAKLYFELEGYFVYTNSSGKAEFDLILSKEGKCFTVEVKTVSSLKTGSLGEYFEVQLKSVRANKTENTIHNFNSTNIDFLAVINTLNNTIFVKEAKLIEAKSSFRVYSNKFVNIFG